jgi:hypothetical protein
MVARKPPPLDPQVQSLAHRDLVSIKRQYRNFAFLYWRIDLNSIRFHTKRLCHRTYTSSVSQVKIIVHAMNMPSIVRLN